MRIYVAAALLIALYLLPWMVNPNASLTTNGYDLAEWASVHPAVQAQTPTLLTSLLLRLPLACIALLVAFCARRGALPALVVVIAAAALLPPLEFVHETGNPNYRQQAVLALLTFVGGAFGVSGYLSRYRRWIAMGIALAGAAVTALGLANGYELMRGFGLSTHVGGGGAGLALAFLIVAGTLAGIEFRQRRGDEPRPMTTVTNQTG